MEDYDADGVLREIFVYTRISFNAKAVNAKWETIKKDIRPAQRRSRPSSLAEAEKNSQDKTCSTSISATRIPITGGSQYKKDENATPFFLSIQMDW